MRILFDTNVIVDVFLERGPFFGPAAQLLDAVEHGELEGLLGATTVTTVYYLVSKVKKEATARETIGGLLQLFEVAAVNRTVLEQATASAFSDFEDAVLHEAGRRSSAEGIVTRDKGDFTAATLTIYTPAELLQALRQR